MEKREKRSNKSSKENCIESLGVWHAQAVPQGIHLFNDDPIQPVLKTSIIAKYQYHASIMLVSRGWGGAMEFSQSLIGRAEVYISYHSDLR